MKMKMSSELFYLISIIVTISSMNVIVLTNLKKKMYGMPIFCSSIAISIGFCLIYVGGSKVGTFEVDLGMNISVISFFAIIVSFIYSVIMDNRYQKKERIKILEELLEEELK